MAHPRGEVSERPKEYDWKSYRCPQGASRVRIPPSPPYFHIGKPGKIEFIVALPHAPRQNRKAECAHPLAGVIAEFRDYPPFIPAKAGMTSKTNQGRPRGAAWFKSFFNPIFCRDRPPCLSEAPVPVPARTARRRFAPDAPVSFRGRLQPVRFPFRSGRRVEREILRVEVRDADVLQGDRSPAVGGEVDLRVAPILGNREVGECGD